jgi:nucleotide-binding universal stress UspA family protein
MERALAVIQDSEVGRRLLREAADLAAGTDAELIVLHVVDETQYSGNIDETIENSRQLADRLAAEVVDGVEYRPMGEVGKLPDAILDAAAEHDCDHVFIVGERKSPAGKVVFGDHAQSVILRFDGPVTTIVGD